MIGWHRRDGDDVGSAVTGAVGGVCEFRQPAPGVNSLLPESVLQPALRRTPVAAPNQATFLQLPQFFMAAL